MQIRSALGFLTVYFFETHAACAAVISAGALHARRCGDACKVVQMGLDETSLSSKRISIKDREAS